MKFFNEKSDYIFLVVATDDLDFGLTIDPFADPTPQPVLLPWKTLTRPLGEITEKEAYELARKYGVLEYLESAVKQIKFMEQAKEDVDDSVFKEWEDWLSESENTAVAEDVQLPGIDLTEISEIKKVAREVDRKLTLALLRVYSPKWFELQKEKESLEKTIADLRKKQRNVQAVLIRKGKKGGIIGICQTGDFKGYFVLFTRELEQKIAKKHEEMLKKFGALKTSHIEIICDYEVRTSRKGKKYLKAFKLWTQEDEKLLKQLEEELEKIKAEMADLEFEGQLKFLGIHKLWFKLHEYWLKIRKTFEKFKDHVEDMLYEDSEFLKLLEKYDAIGLNWYDGRIHLVRDLKSERGTTFSSKGMILEENIKAAAIWYSSKYIVAPIPNDVEKLVAEKTLGFKNSTIWSFIEPAPDQTKEQIIKKNKQLLQHRQINYDIFTFFDDSPEASPDKRSEEAGGIKNERDES